MDVRNCRSCGKLFNYMSGPPICDACRNSLEEKFIEVKEYIRENREAHIGKIAEDCEVSVKQIPQWVREERLMLSEGCHIMIECENCGAPIRTGRFCENCKKKMCGELTGAYTGGAHMDDKKDASGKKLGSNKNRMRFLDNQ